MVGGVVELVQGGPEGWEGGLLVGSLICVVGLLSFI